MTGAEGPQTEGLSIRAPPPPPPPPHRQDDQHVERKLLFGFSLRPVWRKRMDAHKDALVASRAHGSVSCVNGKIIALQINTGEYNNGFDGEARVEERRAEFLFQAREAQISSEWSLLICISDLFN